jgi:hypothetical protein
MAAVWATAADGTRCSDFTAAGELLPDRAEVIGVASAGTSKEFGSEFGSIAVRRRRGFIVFCGDCWLGAAGCPPGSRHVGVAATVDVFGDTPDECQPATGGVAAAAAAAPVQFATTMTRT